MYSEAYLLSGAACAMRLANHGSMTFSETSWLLLGASLGGIATYAIPLGMSLVEGLRRNITTRGF